MKNHVKKTALSMEPTEFTGNVNVGRIVCVDEEGHVFVDFPGNDLGPLAARLTASAKAALGKGADPAGGEVVLIFQNGDPGLPIVLDVIYSLLDEISDDKGDGTDPEKVNLDAKEEIVLRCGESSITLTRAGKIIIRGTYVLSRSSGANKIKGASIELN
jgi:hypothetical protein